MITKEMKVTNVAHIKENIDKSEAIFLTNLVGLKSNEANSVRKKIRDAGGGMFISRNSLIKKATEGHPLSPQTQDLKGPHALAFAFENAPAIAKILYEASKDLEIIQNKGGVLDGKPLSAKDVEALAKLPSRSQMLGTLLATFNAPISAFARVIEAIRENKEKEASN